MKKSNRILMSAAVAGILGASVLTVGASVVFAADGGKGQCMGANACKGKSACATDANSCKGQNACKGKGFLKTSKTKCNAMAKKNSAVHWQDGAAKPAAAPQT